jgi:predicted dehydrogenase
MSKVRVGILGSGFGAKVHVPAFRAQGSFDVAAIASPTSAERIAGELHVPLAFNSLQAMLDGVELDAVSVASPPFDHYESVLLALARGKHVLCEKPFALNVAQADDMLIASVRAGTVCALAHEFRYTPSRLAMHELIANGHLGALREIEYTLFTTTLRRAHERADSWWFRRERGGGLAGALLSHLIDTTNWLAGRAPERVFGFVRTANPQRTHGGEHFATDVDDGAFALVDYGGGLVGRITGDGTHAVESTVLAVHGEDRTAAASGPTILDTRMFTVDDDETAELGLKPDARASLAAAHPNLPPFVNLLDQFAAAIDGKPADFPTFADGVATQRVLAAIGYDVPT